MSIAQGIVFGIISVYVGLAFGCGLSFVFSDYWNHFRRNEKDGEETRDPTMADGKDVKFESDLVKNVGLRKNRDDRISEGTY